MNKIVQRLLIFFVGIPLVLLLIVFSFAHFFLLHLAIVLFCFIGALESHAILKNRLSVHNRYFIASLSAFIPVTATLCAVFGIHNELITFAFIFDLLIILIVEIFSPSSDNFEMSLSRISSSVFILLYPGFLITFISRMTVWSEAQAALILFLLMVFGCDSFAWLFGITMGGGNRELIAASPNKSIAGFIGGVAGTLLPGLGAYFFFPQLFGDSVWRICVLSVGTAFAAILGDLAESVFKRSGQIKDSGHTIPGRGGILDSIDSILMAAPVFYTLIIVLYGFK